MNSQTIFVFLSLLFLSLAFIWGLKRNAELKQVTHNEQSSSLMQPSRLWIMYLAAVSALCFVQNADYVIALAYVIVVVIALLSLSKKWNAKLLAPQEQLYALNPNSSKLVEQFNPSVARKTKLTNGLSSLIRAINLIFLAPILGAAIGISYRAYSSSVEANSIVFTGFIASLAYALFLLYFASVKRVALSSILSLLILGITTLTIYVKVAMS
jgi:hypothetical protein